MSALGLVASQERLLAARSRWTQIFAVVFAGLALAVAASGYILSGGHGVQDFARTAASLVQLVLLLVLAQAGEEGVGGFLLVFAGSAVLTAIFLGLAAVLGAAAVGRRRTRALALGLVLWFVAVLLYDVVALGLASLLPSGLASRLLIVSVLLNPVDAIRTATLIGVEGAAAFGAASLAFLRFTHGPVGAGVLIGASLLAWTVAPTLVAIARLRRADV